MDEETGVVEEGGGREEVLQVPENNKQPNKQTNKNKQRDNKIKTKKNLFFSPTCGRLHICGE